MFTTLTIIVAWFAFGYSVADIVLNARSAKRLDEMLNDIEEMQKKD
jgi:hypothetical protein